MLAVTAIPHQGVNALTLDAIINALRVVTCLPLREYRLLPPSAIADFAPRPRSPIGSWFLDACFLFFSAEWTIVFGFGLEESRRLGLVLLGTWLRPVIE